MNTLRITAEPQTGESEWKLIGPVFGRETTIATGTLYAMTRKRVELERMSEGGDCEPMQNGDGSPAHPLRDFLAPDPNATVEYVEAIA